MRFLVLAAAFLASSAAAQPPREQSPAPREVLESLGLGTSDEELARAVAEANAHPLGTAKNPVRVGGPRGQRDYIGRLRCSDGSVPKVGTRGSAGVGAFGTIADRYPLDCGAAAPGRVELVLDMYHAEHSETRAPAGFTIEPR